MLIILNSIKGKIMGSSKQKMVGFTLVEALVVLAIVAIVSNIAAPSFNNLIQNSRMTTQYNELLTYLSLSRSEAVKHNSTVTICKSDDFATPACGGEWHDGWLIFVDDDGDGVFDVGTDELIRVHAALSGDNTLDYSHSRITFSGDGMASGVFNGTFTLCDSRGNTGRKGMIVSTTGRTRYAVSDDILAACPS